MTISPDPRARPMRAHAALEAATIRAAHAEIPVEFRASPQFVNETLSDRLSAPVVVKVESLNPIGSFKGRGTWLAVRDLVARGVASADRPIVVASTGNFGQGVAYAGRAFGVSHRRVRGSPRESDEARPDPASRCDRDRGGRGLRCCPRGIGGVRVR